MNNKNNDYQNDWNGTAKNGDKLIEGVYFYTVTPSSDKYIYDDKEKSKYTLHGFFEVFK